MKISTVMKKEAVSPVIGIILMVAITVVLAAVFYLWVIGFIGGGVKETPKVTFSVEKDNEDYIVTMLSVSGTVSVYDAKIFIADETGKTVKSGRISDIYGSAEDNVSFLDMNMDEKLSVNDYFIIKGEYAKLGYTFRLIYPLTGGIIGETKLA